MSLPENFNINDQPDNDDEQNIVSQVSRSISVNYIAGTISPINVTRFLKLMYRTSRGNVLTQVFDIDITETVIPGHNSRSEK